MTQVENLDRLGQNQKMYRISKSDFSHCNNPDSIDVLRSEDLKGSMICRIIIIDSLKVKLELIKSFN